MRFLALLTLVAVAAAGCAAKKTVYSANGTTVTSDSSGNAVTVQTSGGTLVMGNNAVDLSKLGVPVYPGATQVAGGSVSMAGASGRNQMTSLTTPDSFDKVYAWYKSRLPADAEKMKAAGSGSSVAEFVTGGTNKGQEQTMVMISQKGDQTSIVLSKGSR